MTPLLHQRDQCTTNDDLHMCHSVLQHLCTQSIPRCTHKLPTSFHAPELIQQIISLRTMPTNVQTLRHSSERVRLFPSPLLRIDFSHYQHSWTVALKKHTAFPHQNQWHGSTLLLISPSDIASQPVVQPHIQTHTAAPIVHVILNSSTRRHTRFTSLVRLLSHHNINTVLVHGCVHQEFIHLAREAAILVIDTLSVAEIMSCARHVRIVPIYSLSHIESNGDAHSNLLLSRCVARQTKISLEFLGHEAREESTRDISPFEKHSRQSAFLSLDSLNGTPLSEQATLVLMAPTLHQLDALEQSFETSYRLWRSILHDSRNGRPSESQNGAHEFVPGHGYLWMVCYGDLCTLASRYERVLSVSHSSLADEERHSISRRICIIKTIAQCFYNVLVSRMQQGGLDVHQSIQEMSHLSTLYEQTHDFEVLKQDGKMVRAPWMHLPCNTEDCNACASDIVCVEECKEEILSVAGAESILRRSFELFSIEFQTHHMIVSETEQKGELSEVSNASV
eukprot:CAMPEP_0117447542 /NCGR_PEP_ID=MMETSP0759-20121206/6931_1 /TAXON_ID=63605 /ORGANISM="Percolomonas cosmopolitus, Strain WS" /LENGTH=506 /DNA_ID=CAMNT_0005239885 /DNA_START=152 /DNA_END=1669 /DNA_ORIENTATION=+